MPEGHYAKLAYHQTDNWRISVNLAPAIASHIDHDNVLENCLQKALKPAPCIIIAFVLVSSLKSPHPSLSHPHCHPSLTDINCCRLRCRLSLWSQGSIKEGCPLKVKVKELTKGLLALPRFPYTGALAHPLCHIHWTSVSSSSPVSTQEEQNRGKPNWEHLNEDLHVLITVEDTQTRAEIKMRRAVEEVKKLLVPAVSTRPLNYTADVASCVLGFTRLLWLRGIP